MSDTSTPVEKRDSERRGLIGQELAGCRIEKKLGQGGMGAVFKAHHLALDIPVAVKVLPPSFAKGSPETIDRFLREARAAARLRHPNVVGVMNVGVDKGLHYIIMEYVEGRSLDQVLRDRGN